MMGHLVLRGNAFAIIDSNTLGEVTALHPVHPDLVSIEMLGNTNWRYRVKNIDGTDSVYTRGDIFHIKGLSKNIVMGFNPIEEARKMLSIGISAQDYGIRYFENDASPSGGYLEHPTNFKDKEARDKFREGWQSQQGGRNKGKAAILEYGIKFHHGIAVKNTDAQFLETQQYTKSGIAALFGVPPHKVGDLSRSTNNNIEHQGIEFSVDSVTPLADCWENAITYCFLDEEDHDLVVNFSTIGLLRGDTAARSEYINTRIMNGSMTRNEARLMEGENPMPGLDEPLRMLNMVTESEAKRLSEKHDNEANQELPEIKDDEPQAVQPNPGDARMAALASAVADRVARKEVAMATAAFRSGTLEDAYKKHAEFVASALGVSIESARTYCTEQMALLHGETLTDEFEIVACAKLARLAVTG